ncbi:hypothetical protein SAMN04488003_11374 [Loktanella fryxellensis]|uniref:Uncharacterized protein n=1 Tax=Loktanella fryxellensis TaxID=245187 RepID=A0A1H8FNC7_9RHOB|nr:DUF6478 family protein [Loktanella fryxellensis]SEN33090.1 hypothetical protein SAMN04488003_11374 [Loktanella fryxellensis]
MARRTEGVIESALNASALRRWSRAARTAATTELQTLRRQRQQARALVSRLADLIHVADSRLALPRIGSTAFARPGGTDWSWRPQAWRGPLEVKGMTAVPTQTMLGNEVTLFHNCTESELTLRQLRNTREEDLAPFALRLDVFRFDGTFLSLVLDLPQDAVQGLQRRHILRVSAIAEVERPLDIFVRLNIKHGPNTDTLVQELPRGGHEGMVEFDLAYTELNEKRLEKAWLDIIFGGPEMNQITLRDLTVCRYPRAEL